MASTDRTCTICGAAYFGRGVCSDPTCRRNLGRRRHVLANIHVPIGELTASTGRIPQGSDYPPSPSHSDEESQEGIPRNLQEEIECILDGLNEIILAMQSIIRRHGVLALRGVGLEEPVIRLARTINLRVRR